MSETEKEVEAVDEAEVVIGMTKQEALDFLAAKNVVARISSEDGQGLMLTQDLVFDRVNLDIVADRVVDYSRG